MTSTENRERNKGQRISAGRMGAWLVASSRSVGGMLSSFQLQHWLAACVAVVVAAILIGVPTAIVPTPWFGRSIEVRPQDYTIWAVSAVLIGLVAATYVGNQSRTQESRTMAGGFVSFLAVGCPTCNKLAVVLLGSSGALSIFAPLQIVLGVGSVALLLWTLVLRADAVQGRCALPSGAAPSRAAGSA